MLVSSLCHYCKKKTLHDDPDSPLQIIEYTHFAISKENWINRVHRSEAFQEIPWWVSTILASRIFVLIWPWSVTTLHTGHLTPSFSVCVIFVSCNTHPSQNVWKHSRVLGFLTISWQTGHMSQLSNFSLRLAMVFLLKGIDQTTKWEIFMMYYICCPK